MQGKHFNISISGTGNSAQLYLNGSLLPGTLQLPADAAAENINTLEFRRCDMSKTPLLFLQAEDMPVSNLIYDADSVSMTIEATRHTVLRFHAESLPNWNEKENIIANWYQEKQLFTLEGIFQKGERITVKK